VHLRLLNLSGPECLVYDAEFGEHLETLVIFLILFEEFGLTEQGFQVLAVAAVILVQNLLEEHETFGVELLLRRAQIDPSLDRSCVQVSRVVLQHFLNALPRTFQLLSVPQEGGSAQQVLVSSHLFTLVLLEDECVNAFLVDVAAPFVEVDEGEGGSELTLTAILDF
jgi:hypothetical protein